jgi:hypothetical protein
MILSPTGRFVIATVKPKPVTILSTPPLPMEVLLVNIQKLLTKPNLVLLQSTVLLVVPLAKLIPTVTMSWLVLSINVDFTMILDCLIVTGARSSIVPVTIFASLVIATTLLGALQILSPLLKFVYQRICVVFPPVMPVEMALVSSLPLIVLIPSLDANTMIAMEQMELVQYRTDQRARQFPALGAIGLSGVIALFLVEMELKLE